MRTAFLCTLTLLSVFALPVQAIDSGEAAPKFTAKALRGDGNLSLDAYRGKVVYLDFWASWCAPCLSALPALDQLRQEFGSRGFEVLAVNVDRNPADALALLARRPVGYRSISDPEGSLPRRFGVETMPTSFLIDRDGMVRYVHRGFRKGDVPGLREHIGALLDEGGHTSPAARR